MSVELFEARDGVSVWVAVWDDAFRHDEVSATTSSFEPDLLINSKLRIISNVIKWYENNGERCYDNLRLSNYKAGN